MIRKLVPGLALVAAGLLTPLTATRPALANDTMAELKTGGLIFVRTDAVAIEREDLYISLDEVRVSYIFKNMTEEDVDALVAFPMPDIQGNPYEDLAVPDSSKDNFLDFEVEVDGRSIQPQLEQRAFAADLDVTAELEAAGIPLNPFSEKARKAVNALPPAVKKDWVARGILFEDAYDMGKGMVYESAPFWRMKSTYWWRMTFPTGRPVAVKHRYHPSVGGTVAVTFLQDGKPTDQHEEYEQKYCIDAAFDRAVANAMKTAPGDYPPFMENWISYVLTTGANWATTIQDFRLTIDKGSTRNFVSFCGEGVKKTGPTTFEMSARDFYPERDIDILFVKRFDN